MDRQPEKLPTWKLIVFALGQLGWSLASYGVSNLVMYFYMPPEDASAHRVFPSFLFEGAVLGLLTIIGLINFGALRGLRLCPHDAASPLHRRETLCGLFGLD